MNKLLFLPHRIPYPPNKGDKITTFNFLKYFSSRCEVYLGTLIDSPEDAAHADLVRGMCRDACFVSLSPGRKKMTSVLSGLAAGEALSLPYVREPRLQAWVDGILADQAPDAILIFSGTMAQYVSDKVPAGSRTLYDMEDVDSEKWRSYAASKPWPLSWLYRREADKLLAFEREMAARFDSTVFVSKEEAELFKSLAPEIADRVTFRTQGVDSAFFDPAIPQENPYPDGAKALVFTGAMDYWPNIDAVTWFAEDVLPKLRQKVPEVLFCIVGLRPTQEVRQLGQRPGVLVTGGVPDVRPYLANAVAAVLPLRIARGIQNKVLEAMAMELPVLASPEAMAGIFGFDGAYVADGRDQMVAKAVALLRDGGGPQRAARQCILDHYDWAANLKRIEALLEGGPWGQEGGSAEPGPP